jgi:hypothetical protein
MFIRLLLIQLAIYFVSFSYGQQLLPDTSLFKDKNGLTIYLNPKLENIGKLTGKLIQEQFDSKIFEIQFDSTYSLTIDSLYRSKKGYVVEMTLYRFAYNPLLVKWFRVYSVMTNWTKSENGKVLKFYDYGYEF